MDEVERILQILQSQCESRVSFLDEVVQSSNRLSILKVLCQCPFATSECTGELLGECLVLAKLDEQRLVKQILDVLVVVERCWGGRTLVGLLLVQRLARVDS